MVISLSSVFQNCSRTSEDGTLYLIWSEWPKFIKSLPLELQTENLGVTGRFSAKRALDACVDLYGDTLCSVSRACSGNRAKVHHPGSGAMPKAMVTFPEIYTLLLHKTFVTWVDNYARQFARGGGAAKKRKTLDMLTERKWISHAQLFCTELADLKPLTIEATCEAIEEFVIRSCGQLRLDEAVLKDHIAPICQVVEPSLLLAKIICRCDLIGEVIGVALRQKLRLFLHYTTHGIDPPEQPNVDPSILQELVDTRQSIARLKSAAPRNFGGYYETTINEEGGTLIARTPTLRDLKSTDSTVEFKTSTVEWSLQSKIAFQHAPVSLVNAEKLIQKMTTGEDNSVSSIIDKLMSRHTLGRHAIILDMALDEMHKDRVAKARSNGTYHGTAWVSDESPPNANRYVGLRFQVTWAYTLWFAPVRDWESSAYTSEYPFVREKYLTDIMNVPIKTGACTLDVINRQMERIGVYLPDYTAGCGDGGGENIGSHGVHRLIEEDNNGYTTKRCMPHISWRTFKAASEAMGDHQKKTEALNSYLRRGITWQRLNSISVKRAVDGGVNMFREFPAGHRDFFPEPTSQVDR